jgi:hypothetical protein
MGFDLKSFAAQVRWGIVHRRPPRPESFDNSVFDAGSPQYVRPEDLFLDIQARIFNLSRFSKQNLGGFDPSDFRNRWLKEAPSRLSLQKVGDVTNEQLVDSVMSLLRCSKRRKERYPTLLPMVPELGFYKNINPNLPNFLNDQLRPALSFADEGGFAQRLVALKERLRNGSQGDDSMSHLAAALLPLPSPSDRIGAAENEIVPHDGPLLKNYTLAPSEPLPICATLKDAIDSLIDLESLLPRLLWTQWLAAALRLWLPLFFLKRCAVTTAAAQAAKSALASSSVTTAKALTDTLVSAEGSLRGSREWLNQLAPIIQNFVRSRFELSILLELTNIHEWLVAQGFDPANTSDALKIQQKLDDYEVDSTRAKNPELPSPTGLLTSVRLSMPGDSGTGRLPFDTWLNWMVGNHHSLDELAKLIGADNLLDLVEKVYAYIRPDYEPLKSGFGKNAHEYVSYTLGAPLKRDWDAEFPDEFNLIYRGEGGRRRRQVQIRPGPRLLVLLVQLVDYQARVKYQTTAKLSDLLDLFDAVGVDFRSNPEDFESVKSELLRLGLLQSSADAAEAASLNPAYSFDTTTN